MRRVFSQHVLENHVQSRIDRAQVLFHVPEDDGLSVVISEPFEELDAAARLFAPLLPPGLEDRHLKDRRHDAHANAPNIHEPGRLHRGSLLDHHPRQLRWHKEGREAILTGVSLDFVVGTHCAIQVDEFPLHSGLRLVIRIAILLELDDIHRLDVHMHEAAHMQPPCDADQGPSQVKQVLRLHRCLALLSHFDLLFQGFHPELLHNPQATGPPLDAGLTVLVPRVIQQLDKAPADVHTSHEFSEDADVAGFGAQPCFHFLHDDLVVARVLPRPLPQIRVLALSRSLCARGNLVPHVHRAIELI
mmetsp:Transcript_107812/g.310511  ORF Transcript_107812/g.310511 Transcript_107812/m.310511 type:complete len:303 (-) Transcript_107812:280-1188(-)